MRATNSLARWGLAACLIGSTGSFVRAQETGFFKEAKLRAGYDFTSTHTKDNLRPFSQGFGINLGYGLGAAGKISVELGYLYNTGDGYLTMASDGSSSVKTANWQPLDASSKFDKSAEERRNEFSGFVARIAYQNDINESWSYQGGLQMGGKYKHQYVGDVRSKNWDANTDPDPTKGHANSSWRDFYNGTPVEGGVNISPFVGVTYRFDKDSSLEMNLLVQRYNSIYYHHYAGTAANPATGVAGSGYEIAAGNGLGPISMSDAKWGSDSLEKNSRTAAHIEIAYVFHF